MALSAQRMLSEPLRRGTSLPLTQLVEKTKAGAGVPTGRPDSSSKTFPFSFFFSFSYCSILMVFHHISTEVKQRSLSLIQAEPAELHFSGFQLQEEYTKTVVRSNVVFEATSAGRDVYVNFHLPPSSPSPSETNQRLVSSAEHSGDSHPNGSLPYVVLPEGEPRCLVEFC